MQRLSDDTESKACAERLAKEFCDFVCSFCKDIGWKWLELPPSNSHHQDYEPSLVGDPNLNLQL